MLTSNGSLYQELCSSEPLIMNERKSLVKGNRKKGLLAVKLYDVTALCLGPVRLRVGTASTCHPVKTEAVCVFVLQWYRCCSQWGLRQRQPKEIQLCHVKKKKKKIKRKALTLPWNPNKTKILCTVWQRYDRNPSTSFMMCFTMCETELRE